MNKDFTIVPQDYIVHHIKTDDMLVHTKDGDYAYHVKTERIPLIRCRECIHCADDWNGNQPMFTCELGRCGESVQPNDFCSYGERESDE